MYKTMKSLEYGIWQLQIRKKQRKEGLANKYRYIWNTEYMGVRGSAVG